MKNKKLVIVLKLYEVDEKSAYSRSFIDKSHTPLNYQIKLKE